MTNRIRAFVTGWCRFFSLHEVTHSMVLKLAFGSLILSYYITFSRFFYRLDTTLEGISNGANVCWPYFQNCRELLFLHTLPYGYSQPILYMGLFGTLFLAVYFLLKNNIVGAQLSLLPSFVWHVFVCFVLTNTLTGNYDYYVVLFGLLLLFFPHKEFFMRLVLVLFYFLSTVPKIYPTWILGTYFSALQTGLPIFPDSTIPVWTNLVIGMEMIGSWFLLSRNVLLQRSAFVFFVLFHLYSGILVGYLYPTIVLTMILIFFGPLNSPIPPPFDRRAIAGWLVVSALMGVQLLGVLIPGDAKLTLEGNRYGLYMFEANHQCISEGVVFYTNKRQERFRRESEDALSRCDPYDYWFRLRAQCGSEVSRISWTFDHSINGGPFFRIVDVPNLCGLSYKPFSHNGWIETENDAPSIVGYPVKNIYR